MSIIIPILLGIFFFKESITFEKTTEIVIALTAIYFTSKKESGKIKIKNIIYPILLFFGAGIVAANINYLQYTLLKDSEIELFLSTTFLSAFFFGIIISVFKAVLAP